MSSDLAAKLRTGTRRAHTAAENVGFMKCFLKGVLDRNSFASLLSNLYFVYSDLEAALTEHQFHPELRRLFFPELHRKGSLEKDLLFFYGAQWRSKIELSSAGHIYAARIRELSSEDPILLIAHSYTRYMGDLSGGQILQKIAKTSLRLDGNAGTAFYQFDQISDKRAFKDKYRQALNEMAIDHEAIDRIVAEANLAFQLNINMSKELDGSLIKAIGQLLYNSLTRYDSVGSTELIGESANRAY